MSVYVASLVPTANATGLTTGVSANYATVRNATTATTTPAATGSDIGQSDSVGTLNLSQYFLTFDTSSIPTSTTSALISIDVITCGTGGTDTIEVRQVSSSANMIAGSSLGSYTLLGTRVFPTAAGRISITLDITSMSRASGTILCIHSQKQRLGTAPTGTTELITSLSSMAAASGNQPRMDFAGPWSIVGTSTTVEATATPLTLTQPAGVADGDLLIATISSRSSATTAPTATGWTAVNSQNNNNILSTGSAIASGAMLYQIRSGTPTLAFTLPAGISVAQGRITAYRGNGAVTPLDVSTAVTAAAGTAVSVTGLTTTVDDDLIVAMTAGGQEATWASFTNVTTPLLASGAVDTTTAPSATAWIKRAETVTTTGVDTSLGVFDAVRTGTGATGNLTVTASVSAGHVVIAGAFKIQGLADAWNKSDSLTMTLSASDKTATASAGGAIRSTQKYLNGAGGKYYAELLMTNVGSFTYVGLGSFAFALDITNDKIYVKSSDGNIYNNVTSIGSIGGGVVADGDILCMAWDSGAELIWFRRNGGNWNNSGTANPATGTGGINVSAMSSINYALWFYGGSTSDIVTIRTELAEYTQTVPSGFTSWMGETPATGGVTVSVTGVSGTGAIGAATITTVASVDVPITGVSAAGSIGTAVASIPQQVSVTGVSGAGAIGTVTPTGKSNVTVTGVSGTGAVGTVSIAGKATATLTGVQGAGAVGTVTISTVAVTNVTVSLTGVSATGSVGGATAPTSSLLVSYTPGSDRNDFTGEAGVRLGVGTSDIPFTWIGARRHSSAQSGTHTVTLYEWFGDTVVRTATIDYTGVAVGSYAWTSVPATTLLANGYYALLMQVTAFDGQTWCNPGAATFSGMVNVYDAYRVPASALATGTPDDMFIGLDLGQGAVGAGVTVTGKSNVTVPGVNATGSIGTASIIGKASVSLPAVAGTGAIGTVSVALGAGVSVSVTSATGTGTVGTVTPTGKSNVTVTGVQGVGAAGTVTVTGGTGVSTLVTGVQGVGAAGSLTITGKAIISLPAVTGAGTAGSVSVSAGGSVSTGVAGVSATGQVGTVTVTAKQTVAFPVTGVSAAGQLGTASVSAKANVSAPGVQGAGAAGTVTIAGKANVSVAGVQGVGTAGTVSVSAAGVISAPVTGVQAAGAIGTVTVTAKRFVSAPLTGVSAAGQVGTVTVTAVELGGRVGVWTGTAWVQKPAKIWSGTAWQQKPAKVWSGTAWL